MFQLMSPNARWQSAIFRKAGLLSRRNRRLIFEERQGGVGTEHLHQPFLLEVSRENPFLQPAPLGLRMRPFDPAETLR